jgi:hypothetical protein
VSEEKKTRKSTDKSGRPTRDWGILAELLQELPTFMQFEVTSLANKIMLFDIVHGSALHGGRCLAYREPHTNFVDESADNVRNEGK